MSILQNYPIEMLQKYQQLLQAVGGLSALFSESNIPFIHYRATENIFCKSFNAKNLARSDIAYDALIDQKGVGIKTFVGSKNGKKMEKVAEFNTLAKTLVGLSNDELVECISTYRNERIELANSMYDVSEAVYHIIARVKGRLKVFETDYSKIDISKLRLEKNNNTNTIQFSDNIHYYSFNKSKSTLYRQFIIPDDSLIIPIEIIADPYEWLLNLVESKIKLEDELILHEFVVLPLYSTKSKTKEVPQKSQLNQWNAGGRKRDYGEIYIPIPKRVHKISPGFFPEKDINFTLITPNGQQLSAKVCQDGNKALMTNPNNALADWLLRKILKLKIGELLTREHLERLEFDSVAIYKLDNNTYKIEKAPFGAYESFSSEDNNLCE